MRACFPRCLAVAIFAVLAGQQAVAQTTDTSTIIALKAQIESLTARLDALEMRSNVRTQTYTSPQSRAPSSTFSAAPTNWADTLKLNGDFRYRHESFDVDGQTDRHRHRLRARTALKAKISDRVNVGFGLASGGSAPTSSNQTLGGGGSSKGINLDLAYVSWQTDFDGLSVTAGKFKNQLFRPGANALIWDGDLRPEGVALKYNREALFANALAFSLDESSGGEDAILIGAQLGLHTALGNGKLITGVGFYSVTDAQGRTPFFNGNALGNRVSFNGSYVNDFEMLEGFAQYSFMAGKHNVTLFADYVQNLEADDFNTGIAFGAKLKQTDWNFGWVYQQLEADAVLGTLSDSDFIGGGTDGEGHILTARYKLSKNIGLRGTLFLNDRNIDFGAEEDFKRLMLDISFKY